VEQRKVPRQGSSKTSHVATTLEERVAQLEALLQTSRSAALPSPQTVVSTQGSPEFDGVEAEDRGEAPGLRDSADLVNLPGSVNGHSDVSRMADPVESIFNNALVRILTHPASLLEVLG
jgi:hypothetical protein